ncbi:MAG: NAD-dependent deacylase [Candidatus Thorarchaeota archaeon]
MWLMLPSDSVREAQRMVKEARRISALTGAGISVDSGIPDFSSDAGLWKRYDPLEYVTHESFLNDPTKFWTMGREIAGLLLNAKPNAAHIALSQLEKQDRLIGIITLNIDNLHQLAGNTRVIELRGNYLRADCTECGRTYFGEEVHRRVAGGQIPPRCEECQGVLKSEAVLFGEPLHKDAMRRAIEVCKGTDLMLVIGTSLQVYPAAYLPELARKNGARIILVSLRGVDRHGIADIIVRGRASEVLPAIVGLGEWKVEP